MRSRWSPTHKAKTNAISYDGSPVGTKLRGLAHTFCRGPTRIRPATAGASGRDLQWRCFHKVKRGNTPASAWLHRFVRLVVGEMTCSKRDKGNGRENPSRRRSLIPFFQSYRFKMAGNISSGKEKTRSKKDEGQMEARKDGRR